MIEKSLCCLQLLLTETEENMVRIARGYDCIFLLSQGYRAIMNTMLTEVNTECAPVKKQEHGPRKHGVISVMR